MRRRAVLSIATAAVTAAVIGGGGVMVGTRAAAQPHHDGIEQQISALIDKMTTAFIQGLFPQELEKKTN